MSAADLPFLLSAAAAREYLEEFLFVGLEAGRAFPGGNVHSPEDCLDLLNGQIDTGPIPFVDLRTQQHDILPALESNVFQVIKSCRFILGPEVEKLEKRLAEYVQIEHAISCSSGTEALVLALLSLDIGPKDAVFTTPFTFIATAGAICQVGATPVFVDIDPRTFNLDPVQLETAILALARGDANHPLPRDAAGLTPRAVLTVDLFGLPADHQRIQNIAAKYGLVVIEDAAQAFGGEERGSKACTLGEIGCTSFFPAKPLGAYGEGGACFTRNSALAETMRSIRVHGQGTSRYEHARLGTNARLDSLQAAILLAKMHVFPAELARRADAATAYTRLLSQVKALKTPIVPDGFASAWAQYSLLARDKAHRDACQGALREQGIPTMIYYPIPLHLQRVFMPLGYSPGDFPETEQVSQKIFSLPMHPYLSSRTQERIAAILRNVNAS
ncbi:MAG TPA: DegT/DnrJ/EryC1/StrS family aminotransferase [Desulfonatronum sp.]|nr:DegT/DnrJ/EryC1/StrS family aminotransferase [Desulfonatronum sp.]